MCDEFYCTVNGVVYKLVKGGYSDQLACCEGCVAHHNKKLCHTLGDACGEHILYIWRRDDTK